MNPMYTKPLTLRHHALQDSHITSFRLLTSKAGMLAHIAKDPWMPIGTSCKVMLLVELTFHPSCKPSE